MPMQRHLYPANWEKIAFVIKHQAGWQCDRCGKACRLPDEEWIDFLKRMNWSLEKCIQARPGQYTLGVAHLDHRPQNCDLANLRAWCNPCHCRYDLAAMGTKRRLKAERNGQLRLFDLVPPEVAGHGKDPGQTQLPISLEEAYEI